MFDRFIRLARAKKALQEGRFEDAAVLADDPLIRADRRAESLRTAAQAGLVARGKKRLADGDPTAAVRDLQRAVAVTAHAEAEVLLADARGRVASAEQGRHQGQRAIDEARRAAECGKLQTAATLLASVGDAPALVPAAQALRTFLESRRQQAELARRRAAELLGQRRIDDAIEAARTAHALDAEAPDSLAEGLVRAASERLAEVTGDLLRTGDPGAAAAAFRQRLLAVPQLQTDRRALAAGGEVAAALRDRLRAAERPEAMLDLVQVCALEPALPGVGPQVLAAAQLLQRLPGLRAAGRAGELASALTELGRQLDLPAFVAEAKALRKGDLAAGERVQEARTRAAAGDLVAARGLLVEILQEQPMHEDARSELDSIDRGVREREQRLDAARQAGKAGRLREAYGLALAHAQPGPAGEEARLFAQDLRARIDLVGRGIDQVRAALHSRSSGGIAGLRHCLLRVDELAKVQSDHEDLPALRRALEAEIAGIESAEAAALALAKGNHAAVAHAIEGLVGQREHLLLADRLDARILDLADRLVATAETALAAGRLAALEPCLIGIAAAVPVRADCAAIVERLRTAAGARRTQAEALAVEAAELLAARDLTAAEARCEAARQLWVDGSAVRKVEESLQSLRQQEAQLERVEAMAAGGNVEGAHAELGEMPPTPAMLRTRIFDMKQNLARAQGLDGAFLLRVDEGGEFVAVRGDSVTIGNLRDGRSDLPILAAIAGRHARVQRSMSFHGGMQDRIVAEGGELRVAGGRVQEHRLRPGDRIQLGAALQVAYGQPSKRSLTATLQLLGGFQVAGTDRVLLFKDRGRDGRILIGPGNDVHVRVPGAKGEIEVFANKDGQMRVRCEAGGEIDGRPFRGEHPVAAGAMIRAVGVSFVLLPWMRPV